MHRQLAESLAATILAESASGGLKGADEFERAVFTACQTAAGENADCLGDFDAFKAQWLVASGMTDNVATRALPGIFIERASRIGIGTIASLFGKGGPLHSDTATSTAQALLSNDALFLLAADASNFEGSPNLSGMDPKEIAQLKLSRSTMSALFRRNKYYLT